VSANVSEPTAARLRARFLPVLHPGSVVTAVMTVSGNAAITLTFVLLIGLPLGLVLLQAFVPALVDASARALTISLEPMRSALSDPRTRIAIVHSLSLGMVSAVTATLLGGAYALMMRRTDVALRGLLATTPWLVFLTPGYLKALAWVLLMSPNGYLSQLGLLSPVLGDAFFGLGGLVFVHTLTWFPLAYFIINGAMAGLGSEFEDAARTVGASAWTAWLRVNLPLLAPAIMLSLLTVFADVLSDFGMAATIARRVDFGLLTYGIYTSTTDYPVNFALAGSQALLLLAMIVAVVMADRLLRRQTSARLISGRARPARIYALGRWRWPVACLGILVAVLAVDLPLVALVLRAVSRTLGQGLVAQNMTAKFISQALTLDHPSNVALLRSLQYAGLTAVISAGFALLLACWLDRGRDALRQVILATAVGSVAIPGIILGLGYILVWNRLPGFRDVPLLTYGSWPLLVTGYVATALPYALVIIMAAVGQVSPSLVDAARLHGAGAVGRMLRIIVPLIAVSLLGALLFVFLRTIFELPMSRLLIPTSGPPAPALIVRLFENDDEGIGAALSFLSMAAAALVAAAIWFAARRAMKHFGRPRFDELVGLPGHR